MSDHPVRPQTPQAMLHRLPDKPDPSPEITKPSKYIILLMASISVSGKVDIAKSVSDALSCPLFQGDSLHETSSKAASVGASKRAIGTDENDPVIISGPNEARYQRMWLSKMTRTGYLFPGESRAANEGFAGFGGASSTSTSTSRRGSASSVASLASSSDSVDVTPSIASSFMSSGTPSTKYTNTFTLSEQEKLRKENPALLVVTHPDLEQWHKDSIRKAICDYGIGVIFVPLYPDEELPILKPLDPRTMTSFVSLGSFSTSSKASPASLDEEILLRIDVEASMEERIGEIVNGVREIMAA